MKFDKKISIMIQLVICKEVKHGLPLSKRKVKRWPKDMIAAGVVIHSWPEIGWHGSSGGPK